MVSPCCSLSPSPSLPSLVLELEESGSKDKLSLLSLPSLLETVDVVVLHSLGHNFLCRFAGRKQTLLCSLRAAPLVSVAAAVAAIEYSSRSAGLMNRAKKGPYILLLLDPLNRTENQSSLDRIRYLFSWTHYLDPCKCTGGIDRLHPHTDYVSYYVWNWFNSIARYRATVTAASVVGTIMADRDVDRAGGIRRGDWPG